MKKKPRNLTCPACENILVEENVCGLNLDICKNGCAGIWFDRGELEKVDEKCERNGIILLDINKNPEVTVDFSKKRICPTCKPEVEMRKHYWSIKAEVELDECDKCGGIWLDDGELKKIRNLYESETEKIADERKYFASLSVDLLNKTEEQKRENAAWYDKLAYAIFGI